MKKKAVASVRLKRLVRLVEKAIFGDFAGGAVVVLRKFHGVLGCAQPFQLLLGQAANHFKGRLSVLFGESSINLGASIWLHRLPRRNQF